MSPFSSHSDNDFHPFLESLAELIRTKRSDLKDIRTIKLDSDLEAFCKSVDGDTLCISNEFHSCTAFRKIHLEIVSTSSGLQIFHCVFFPDPCFDLPIFGTDLVIAQTGITAAIVDLSPVTSTLPRYFNDLLSSIIIPSFSCQRKLPSWGSIFSPYVQFIRPENPNEEKLFLELVDTYLQILISSLDSITPDSLDSPLTIERNQGQTFYCLQQKRNDKTRGVLEKAFDADWADRYINHVLFDLPKCN